MTTLMIILMCYFLFLAGTPTLAGIGWLLDRLRSPERNRAGGLPRLVGGTAFLFCAMFGMASLAVIHESDDAASMKWLLALLASLMTAASAIGGRHAVRALQRRRDRTED